MINLPDDTPVISEMTSDEYYKGYMGKWHLGNDIERQRGFNVWKSTEDSHGSGYTHTHLNNETSSYTQYLISIGSPLHILELYTYEMIFLNNLGTIFR